MHAAMHALQQRLLQREKKFASRDNMKMAVLRSLLAFLASSAILASASSIFPTLRQRADADASTTAIQANQTVVNQTTCDGEQYTYQQLAGYGFVPSNARDKYGDTLGGYGSAIAINRGSWKKLNNGSYTGTLWAVPDRGWYVADVTGQRWIQRC